MDWHFDGTVFETNIAPKQPSLWDVQAPQAIPRPDFADDEELKKAYGIAMGEGLAPFNAALRVFKDNQPQALWAINNWRNDPVVIASRDAYLSTLRKARKPLDKEELLEELLTSARAAIKDADRMAFFKLYSEVAGFTGKASVSVDASTNFSNTDNSVKIVLVKGAGKEAPSKIVEASPINNAQSKMPNLELPVKLVSSR